MTLFRQHAGPRLATEGLVFALPSQPEGRVLSVAPSGEVTLVLTAPDGPQRPQDAPNPSNHPIPLPAPVPGPAGDPTAPQEASQPLLPTPDADKERERVHLVGRLGADPRFRETRTGVLIGAFPLAVPRDDGSTRWEQVVAFRDRAANLAMTSEQLVGKIGGRPRR